MKNSIRWIVFWWILAAGAAQAAPFAVPSSGTISPAAVPSKTVPSTTASPETISPATTSASSDGLPGYLTSSWEKLSSALTEALNLQDKQESLPESTYFGEDKSSNAKKINALLSQAIEILLQGDANDLRRQAIKLRTEVPVLRLELDGLRNKRISAPEASKLPWVQTRPKIDARVEELNAEIKDKERTIADIDKKIAGALREMGLDLDDAQIDVLLTSVTGDDLFQNTVIFANVKRVVEKLEELSGEDRDNLEINRRYTGMYLVLNDLLILTQEGLVEKIDGSYKPQLTAIRTEAAKLRTEALGRSKQAQYNESQRQSFEANAKANAMTIRVAELYTSLLESQRGSATATLSDLRRNRDLAENTYKTVRSTSDLRNLIRSGLDLFDSIQNLSMPRLQPFESEAIRKEFEEINKRLKK
ncbi:MAG: hypothetical protein LBQ42_11510 [Synergistaceae bacterium]|jgi:hypothetical protein|nr:hypothetical protein [Synergistaceae bacterium]